MILTTRTHTLLSHSINRIKFQAQYLELIKIKLDLKSKSSNFNHIVKICSIHLTR